MQALVFVLAAAMAVSSHAVQLAGQLKGLHVEQSPQGITVVEVDLGTPVSELGVRKGDIILSVNERRVGTVAQLREYVNEIGNEPLLLELKKEGAVKTVIIAVRRPATERPRPR